MRSGRQASIAGGRLRRWARASCGAVDVSARTRNVTPGRGEPAELRKAGPPEGKEFKCFPRRTGEEYSSYEVPGVGVATRRGVRCDLGDAAEEGQSVEHWTQVLTNVSLVEFVLLAALTTLQWIRHRIRGAGWVALSFAILGGISLVAMKYDPDLVTTTRTWPRC